MTIQSLSSVDVPREATAPAMTGSASTAATPEYQERWNAWRARGARNDLAMRRRWQIVGVAIVITGGVVAAAFGLWQGAM